MATIKVGDVAKLNSDDLETYHQFKELKVQCALLGRIDSKRKKLQAALLSRFDKATLARLPDGTILLKKKHERDIDPLPDGRTDTWYSLEEVE